MAHHRRGKPKSARAGCLLCKPHKRQGSPLAERQRYSLTRALRVADEQRRDAT